MRRHFITVDNLRAAVTKLVNATFAARDTEWWGQGNACASDSKKFGSWSSNFMTEYHARYGGNGVMIYDRQDGAVAVAGDPRVGVAGSIAHAPGLVSPDRGRFGCLIDGGPGRTQACRVGR